MVVPTLAFFMPLPLAMMIPFMGIQSAVMAKQFGENFQYGKRRISAMSNEEFNKLTPTILQERANAELKAMIPTMEASVRDMRTFQVFLIKEFLSTVNDILRAGIGTLFGLNEDTLSNIEHFLHGHVAGHDDTTQDDDEDKVLSEQCGAGMHWSKSAQQCVPDTVTETPPPPPPTPPPDELIKKPQDYKYWVSFDYFGTTAYRAYDQSGEVISVLVTMMTTLTNLTNPQAMVWRHNIINAFRTKYPEIYQTAFNVFIQQKA